MKLQISDKALQVMQEDAIKTYPEECCGFFYGKEADHKVVTEAIPVHNTKEENRERRFEISPRDYLEAERYAEENGLTLLGVYHSHPDHPALPSEHDRKQALPWFSYIIISVLKGKLDDTRSWTLDENRKFKEEIINKPKKAEQYG